MAGARSVCEGVHPQHREVVSDRAAPAALCERPGPCQSGIRPLRSSQSSQEEGCRGGSQAQRQQKGSKGEQTEAGPEGCRKWARRRCVMQSANLALAYQATSGKQAVALQPLHLFLIAEDVSSRAVTCFAGGKGGEKKKETKLGLSASKKDDFGEWYSEAVIQSEMISYYDVSGDEIPAHMHDVPGEEDSPHMQKYSHAVLVCDPNLVLMALVSAGCYILRPNSFAIWEAITAFFDKGIKALGVQNAYFPLFVTEDALNTEKDHVEGFAAEVGAVTGTILLTFLSAATWMPSRVTDQSMHLYDVRYVYAGCLGDQVRAE